MPTGLDHVQAEIPLCQRLSAEVLALPGAEEPWAREVAARLTKVQGDLAAMQARFFLRSKLCLPFAARCEQEARRLEQAFAGWGVGTTGTTVVEETLAALERAVKILDDRSGAQGMVIT